jgi:hypothetical protein
MGVVCHIQEGFEAGTNSAFHNRTFKASAHFGNPFHGPPDQWVDTKDKAWAQVDGNPRWLSVEFEGFATRKESKAHGVPWAPNANQIENAAQLLAWAHLKYGVPLRTTSSVNRGGLGWHGMGGDAWGGHFSCPGWKVKRSRRKIVRRAKAIVKAHKGS